MMMPTGPLPPDGNGEPETGESKPVAAFTENAEMLLSTLLTTYNPLRLAVAPNDQFVYATNVQAGTVSAFGIITGGLSPIAEFPTGQHPFGVALDSKGSFLCCGKKPHSLPTGSAMSMLESALRL
jgi:6-phosphogluconolactonase (cycloisomerase 2 family)